MGRSHSGHVFLRSNQAYMHCGHTRQRHTQHVVSNATISWPAAGSCCSQHLHKQGCGLWLLLLVLVSHLHVEGVPTAREYLGVVCRDRKPAKVTQQKPRLSAGSCVGGKGAVSLCSRALLVVQVCL